MSADEQAKAENAMKIEKALADELGNDSDGSMEEEFP